MAVNETLAEVSNNFVYSAMAVYALAMVSYAAEAAFASPAAGSPAGIARQPASAAASYPGAASTAVLERTAPATPTGLERLGRVAVSLTLLAFVLHAAGVVTRGLSAGRVPWSNMYEFSTAGALVVTGAYLLLLRKDAVRYLGVWVTAVVLLMLGLAVTVLYVDSGELVPALDSYWLVIHVAAAFVTAGILTVAAAATVLYLVRARAESRLPAAAAVPGYAGRLPTAAVLDRVAHRLHGFAFPIWTFAIVAGAIWAESAWGRYWGWDPKETWAFITWVVYAAYLHARATAGSRGRTAAVIALVGYATFTFNYFGVNALITNSLHSYGGL